MAKESLREHLNRKLKEKGTTLKAEKAKGKKYKSIAEAKKAKSLYYTDKNGKVMAAVYATDLKDKGGLKTSLRPVLRPKPDPKDKPKTTPKTTPKVIPNDGPITEKTKVNKDDVVHEFDAMWSSSLTDSTAKGKPDIELVDMNIQLT